MMEVVSQQAELQATQRRWGLGFLENTKKQMVAVQFKDWAVFGQVTFFITGLGSLCMPQFWGLISNTSHSVAVGGCPARARRATFVLLILTLTLDLPSPRGAPQVDRSGLQTFPTKHAA